MSIKKGKIKPTVGGLKIKVQLIHFLLPKPYFYDLPSVIIYSKLFSSQKLIQVPFNVVVPIFYFLNLLNESKAKLNLPEFDQLFSCFIVHFTGFLWLIVRRKQVS